MVCHDLANNPHCNNYSPGGGSRHAGVHAGSLDLKPGLLGTTWEITQPPSSPEEFHVFRRLEKWALQAAAREILASERSLQYCCRALIPQREFVDIWKTQYDRYHYGGLITCGSCWQCPVCSGKIAIRRQVEVSQAMVKNRELLGSEMLLTLTAPHRLGEFLSFLLRAMSHAHRLLLNRKPWKRIFNALGLRGTIRGLEVTHSFENGWHVHFHVLLFLSCALGLESLPVLEEMIFHQWKFACLTAGLEAPSQGHGVRLEDGSKAAAYVTKWGLDDELTKSQMKSGREGHYTPFDFLRFFLAGDPRYAALFQEYAKVFKGKKQLVWSRGLRDALGMDAEISDQELAESQEESAIKFASIPLNAWRIVLKHCKQGHILEVCRKGVDALYDYIIELLEKRGD